MVDALEENRIRLERVGRYIDNADFCICLLGEREAEQTPFYVVNDEITPGLFKTGSSKYVANPTFAFDGHVMRQRTLGSLLQEVGGNFQFLKLDVQGAELDVIAGLGPAISSVEVILMEMSLVDYNKGAPLIADVLSAMGRYGFVLSDIASEHRDGPYLFQVDGIFRRKDSKFRAQPPF